MPRLRSFTTGSSRMPSDLACRTRPVWQSRTVPALSALLPALPGVSRIGLRSAPTEPLRRPGEEVSHLPRFPAPHGAPAPRGATCCLSATGIRFPGTLSRQRDSAPLTIGLPAGLHIPVPAGRTLARFPRSARVRPGPGRAPSLPRGQRCSPAVGRSAAAACRLSTAGPCHPGDTTQPGMLN